MDKEKQKKAILIGTLFVDVATPFWHDMCYPIPILKSAN